MKPKGNIYTSMLLALLAVMFLFSFSRVAFYLFNTSFFPDMTLPRFLKIIWGGFIFDRVAVLYTNALFILMLIVPFNFRFNEIYLKIVKWVFLVTNGIALVLNTSDIAYYRFTLRRTSSSLFTQFENETNIGLLFLKFIFEYWYLTLLYILMMFFLVQCYKRIPVRRPVIKRKLLYHASAVLLMGVCIVLFIGGVRGDFRHSTRPITLSNAGEYVSEPRDVNIVLNTPFAIYRTLQRNIIKKVNYYKTEEELNKEFTPVRSPVGKPFNKLNVVVFILESFGREYFGAFNKDVLGTNYTGYTPFLDSLAGKSKSYLYAYANGRKSIDALPSITSSIPSIEVPYVLSNYSSNKTNSLGTLLQQKGYYTSFFHGAPNGSMGFKAFVNINGYRDYFGKTEYEEERGSNDYDGIWGIWDENFMQYYADKMNTFSQPFHSVLFSTSSHHPYNIPDKHKDKFKGGSMSIYRTIEYTDYSLRLFFEKVSKMPWFKNTVFVITADHCSAQVNYDEYRNAAGFFWIPLMFYHPGSDLQGMDSSIAQQIDIMPTVLNYLGYDNSYLAYGCDLLNPSEEKFAFNYLNNTYQLFMNDYLLLFDGSKPIALYKFRTDLLLKNNLLPALPEVAHAMEKKIKAIIQQYNNRMVDNKLTIE